MAFTEYAVINPRRRRHARRRRRGVARTTRRRRRRRSLVAYNPRPRRRLRRRRHSARRSHRRRHNPRGLSIGRGSIVKVATHAAALVAGGAVADLAGGFISQYVPKKADGKTPIVPPVAIVAGVGMLGLPLLINMTPLKRFAPTVALGAAVIVGWELYNAYIKPNLPLHGLGIYGTSEEAAVSGLGVYGGGIVGQGIAGLGFGEDSMYADSMYT